LEMNAFGNIIVHIDFISKVKLFFVIFAMISFFTYLGNLSSLEIVNAQQSSGFTGNNLDQQNGNNIVTNSVNQNSGTLNTLGNNNIPTDTQGIDSFVLSGPVSSYIHTQQSDWVVGGNWYLKAQDGNLTNFIVQMKWDPTNVNTSNVKTHYHDFSFFRANPSQNIVLGSKNQTQINGIMDVGLGLQSHNWRNVPAQINTAGNTIKISLDDSKTGGHFNNYPVYGKILFSEICSDSGKQIGLPNMTIIDMPRCSS